MEFPQLDLAQLIDEGRKALHEEDYLRAVPIFRESIRRAPFRQELKDWLAMAVEGSLIQEGDSLPRTQSTLVAISRRERNEPTAQQSVNPPVHTQPDLTMGVKANRPVDDPQPVFRPTTSRGVMPAPSQRKHQHSTKPSHFEKRHRRGPLSALLLGALVGLVLIGSVVAGVYIYLGTMANIGQDKQTPSVSRAQINAIVEQAYTYRQKGEYALAIAQLNTLPEGDERNKLLAETYMEQGNLNFIQDPPQIESAIEAYSNAVRYDADEPEYGYSLGMAYLDLGRQKKEDPETSEHYLALSQQSFQAVLDRHPDHVGSLDGLSKVAVLQRDNVTAANAWRHIIEVAPDSYEAERARNNLKSLNYKF